MEISDISSRVWSFLQTAMEDREPTRDIAVAKAIVSDIYGLLAKAKRKGVAIEPLHVQAVERTVSELVLAPARWSRAIMLAHLYLHNERHDQTDSTEPQDQLNLQFNLGDSLLDALLGRARSDDRIQFFQNIDDWQVYHAVEQVLPTAILTEQEVLALLVHSAEFGRGDMALGLVLQAISKWASNQPDVAMSIVNQWVDDQVAVSALDESAIRSLVTGVVRGSSDVAWRNTIVDKLDSKGRKQDRKLALILICHAWPVSDEDQVEERHKSLIERTRRYPEFLVDTALWAIRFDTEKHPIEAFATARKLYALLPDDSNDVLIRNATAGLIAVAWRAIPEAKQKELDLTSFIEVLDYALNYAPELDLLKLDSVLSDLSSTAEEQVGNFLQKWITKYGGNLSTGDHPLNELFPLLFNKRPGLMDDWLVGWMVSASSELRKISAILFGRRTTKLLPRESLLKMSRSRVYALCHILTGSPFVHGSIWVPALMKLGTVRPDTLDLVKECLQEDALEQYPGYLRESLTQWPDAEPWARARAQLFDRLDARLAAKDLRRGISELHYFPTQSVWRERQQAELAKSMATAQQKSVWMQIATRVPIARGESSSQTGDPNEAVPFTHYEGSLELPALEIVDPVQARLRGLEHQRQAERLIAIADGEDHAPPG
jgi:hypothetical protein